MKKDGRRLPELLFSCGECSVVLCSTNLSNRFYPRPADSIRYHVCRSVGRSVGLKFFCFANFSALGLDRDLGFSRGPPSGIPPRS